MLVMRDNLIYSVLSWVFRRAQHKQLLLTVISSRGDVVEDRLSS